jgi:hypothetical protein
MNDDAPEAIALRSADLELRIELLDFDEILVAILILMRFERLHYQIHSENVLLCIDQIFRRHRILYTGSQ